MKTIDDVQMPRSEELKSEAIRVLLDKLGPAKTAVLIRDYFSKTTDYLKLKDKLFENATVESLVREIQVR